MAILGIDDHEAIRKAIHVDFNEHNLKSAWIVSAGVITDAELELASRGVVYVNLSADQQKVAKRGVILLAASYLAPAVRGIISLSSTRDGISYSVPAFSGDKRANELLERSNGFLNPLPSSTKSSKQPTLFAVASSRRGR